MSAHSQKRFLLGALFAASVLVAGYLGYAAGAASPDPQLFWDGNVADSGPILAVLSSGETSALSEQEAEAFEEHTAPIDQSDVTFTENIDLSLSEVEERKDALAADYVVGEPLSIEDLEFMRAYLIEKEPDPDSEILAIETAALTNSGSSIVPAALFGLNQSFNVTKSGAGATANAKGTITGGINLVDATWGVSWNTKRTAGVSLTKIKSSVNAYAYGAVIAWPFVGLIYSKAISATSPAGASSWSFARSGNVTGAVAYMQIECRSYVYTSSGTFSLP
jgi:hypothetical protein